MPAFDVVSEMLDILLETKTSQAAAELGLEGLGGKERAWVAPLADNKRRWKEQCQPPTKGNHDVILTGFDILGFIVILVSFAAVVRVVTTLITAAKETIVIHSN